MVFDPKAFLAAHKPDAPSPDDDALLAHMRESVDAGSVPAAATEASHTFDPKAFIGQNSSESTQAPEDRGLTDAISREASNLFGLGPVMGAATETVVSKLPAGVRNTIARVTGNPMVANPDLTFGERRQAYADALDQARANHPVATTLTGVGRGVGEAVLVPEVQAMQGLAPVAKATVAGLGYGAATGAGEAISHGKDAGEVIHEAEKGAAFGGATAGLLTAGARAVTRKAAERLTKGITREITEGAGTEGAATKTAKMLVAKDKDDIVDLVLKDHDIADAITQRARDGLPTVEAKMSRLGEQLDPHYDTLDQLTTKHLGDYRAPNGGGGFKTQGLVEALDKHISELDREPGNDVYVNVFKNVRQNIADRWNKATLVDPDGQPVRELENLNDAVTPTRSLRRLVTKWQTKAQNVINPLNPGEATQVKQDVAGFLKGYLDTHLNDVASKAGREGKEAVDAIRDINRDYSAAANIQKAMEQRYWKEETGSKSLMGHGIHGIATGLGIQSLMSGHPVRAAAEVAGTYLLPPVARKASGVVNSTAAGLVRNAGESVMARRVLSLVEKGIPMATAITMAQQGDHGVLNDLGDVLSPDSSSVP